MVSSIGRVWIYGGLIPVMWVGVAVGLYERVVAEISIWVMCLWLVDSMERVPHLHSPVRWWHRIGGLVVLVVLVVVVVMRVTCTDWPEITSPSHRTHHSIHHWIHLWKVLPLVWNICSNHHVTWSPLIPLTLVGKDIVIPVVEHDSNFLGRCFTYRIILGCWLNYFVIISVDPNLKLPSFCAYFVLVSIQVYLKRTFQHKYLVAVTHDV